MKEREKQPNEIEKDAEKPRTEEKATENNLGYYLLEKEFRMNETAKKIIEEHESKKSD
ncbi:MAG: hypothetical protein GF353_06120 [Candidatus Lokiarchaeota archaeon]|nr:hypothetical protein [Candidatus Lokiarchaeota archaeon]